MNRDLHERRGVIRVDDFHPWREERFHFFQFGANSGSGIQRVGAGSQFDAKT
ncbi:Uncharacterised protein [Salmonella enterica subsp. enterica serovar Bovismorbificans]|uniref:Uncharacterized protein n=1 Tax=Salmonella enterica subsp. enterica serovar Bovismorbificans TaxID=58097 RepID=A0A655EAP2_SALET|nr:Uncharacterised protein [Salmonella enterica subsp. enterica serovar Bovismorbificans]CNU78181.1 Uncharacterised protein [Salmonella enterica subsp. enterica serovar Bovismorbificans]CNV12868.1 Uncharacterised protein [Salmonella enterica subsp. enterica serovar Bovismorbificans]CPR49234.1 Uncharacterised protein [Salmonella enterica subsp. enterica serovar Bovismorbificans]